MTRACEVCNVVFERWHLKPAHIRRGGGRFCSRSCANKARPPHTVPLSERFWSKVDKSGDCWIWKGSMQRSGYGHIHVSEKPKRFASAHRVAWELCGRVIPPGMVLDHLCRTPACVNPDHLEPVTQRENALRGVAPNVLTFRKRMETGICANGHPASRWNRVRRYCRSCLNDAQRQRKQN